VYDFSSLQSLLQEVSYYSPDPTPAPGNKVVSIALQEQLSQNATLNTTTEVTVHVRINKFLCACRACCVVCNCALARGSWFSRSVGLLGYQEVIISSHT
jgi:hypothetical protein